MTDYPLDSFRAEDYEFQNAGSLLTPSLLIYPGIVDRNITSTLGLLENNPNRWRPHVKTAKLEYTMRRMVQRGVTNFKCATTLELLTACRTGAADILVAYPMCGANAERVKKIASQHSAVRISVLVESPEGLASWSGSPVGVFVDVNPGMNRTGVDGNNVAATLDLVRAIRNAGLAFRGLHYYDGHIGDGPMPERATAAHAGYHQLLKLVSSIEREGIAVEEVVTSGTPAFPCAIDYAGFRSAAFIHRVSPGTVVYCDLSTLRQLPGVAHYQPAALVLARVVSHPTPHRFTCDAGHKSVGVDSGVPNCAVLGYPTFAPQRPTEEHLPMDVPEGIALPKIGEMLYLVPRHVCPTVNNFDVAALVESHQLTGLEPVTARGHEPPLWLTQTAPR